MRAVSSSIRLPRKGWSTLSLSVWTCSWGSLNVFVTFSATTVSRAFAAELTTLSNGTQEAGGPRTPLTLPAVAATLLAAALLVLACLAVGAAALRVCRRPAGAGYAAAVGLAIVMVVASLAIKLPGDAVTACVVLGVLALGAAFHARRELLRKARPRMMDSGLSGHRVASTA